LFVPIAYLEQKIGSEETCSFSNKSNVDALLIVNVQNFTISNLIYLMTWRYIWNYVVNTAGVISTGFLLFLFNIYFFYSIT